MTIRGDATRSGEGVDSTAASDAPATGERQPVPEPDRAGGNADGTRTPRHAVVVVHGMGSQRPVQTLDGFVQTALRPVGHKRRWRYYSRPAEITRSYEARRYIAPELNGNPPPQRHTEIFEYHWSYLMTGNRFGDLLPTTLRLVMRRLRGVPDPLLGAWRLVWHIVAALMLVVEAIVAVVLLAVSDGLQRTILAILTSGVTVTAATMLVGWVGAKIAASFVDVTRYLDTSPRSYAARRAIRGGLVDLLRALHEANYDRIVVVAHSLGGYIAYDALSSLWAEMHEVQAGPPGPPTGPAYPVAGLEELEKQAALLLKPLRERQPAGNDASRWADANATVRGQIAEYQRRQFTLWQGLRKQGNPWRVTDFITVGTPMYIADLLLTRPKLAAGWRDPSGRDSGLRLFDDMLRRGELVRCPPRSERLTVEDRTEPDEVSYGWSRGRAYEVLGSQSPFAVVRWTNLWFPVRRGRLGGDWFGGPLRPLYGPGILDQKVLGNTPGRLAPAIAHTRYFRFGQDDSAGSIARLIRNALGFERSHVALVDLLTTARQPDPRTAGPSVAAATAAVTAGDRDAPRDDG